MIYSKYRKKSTNIFIHGKAFLQRLRRDKSFTNKKQSWGTSSPAYKKSYRGEIKRALIKS